VTANPSSYVCRDEFLPFSPPDIGEEEIAAVVDTLRSGWVTSGPKSRQFAQDFAAFVNAEAGLGVNSCTGGLHIALATLGIGAGDEVITTTMTFTSSVNVIEHVGAKPVLVDIDPDTLNMNPERVAEAITERTKAIMPVHYSGHPVDMSAIKALADEHDLYIIEDAAHSVPAQFAGQMIGSIGDLTSFSFYATKNMTTGEGGMLTGKQEYIERAKLFCLHGMSRDAWKRYSATGSWYYEVVEAGFKYNMTDIQAAMGLVQLGRLPQMQQRRYEVVEMYNDAFSRLDALQAPIARDNVQHAWHLYVMRLNLDHLSIDRAQFIDEMKARNIGTSVHFIPVHLHPFYADKYGFQPQDYPVAYGEYQRTVSLPLHSGLSDDNVADVIAAVTNIVDTYGK
jgi:dTDP-4-amino-4,6-dideoxygalactose transaminase